MRGCKRHQSDLYRCRLYCPSARRIYKFKYGLFVPRMTLLSAFIWTRQVCVQDHVWQKDSLESVLEGVYLQWGTLFDICLWLFFSSVILLKWAIISLVRDFHMDIIHIAEHLSKNIQTVSYIQPIFSSMVKNGFGRVGHVITNDDHDSLKSGATRIAKNSTK